MIKANELRIGNLIADHEAGGYFQIEEIYKVVDDYWVSYRKGSIKCAIDELEEIPLTEEWLVKFGFEEVHFKNRHYSITDKNGFKDSHKISILPTINEQWYIAFSDTLFGYKDYIPTTKIKYVHQLQNLYFALTGEELTIKN